MLISSILFFLLVSLPTVNACPFAEMERTFASLNSLKLVGKLESLQRLESNLATWREDGTCSKEDEDQIRPIRAKIDLLIGTWNKTFVCIKPDGSNFSGEVCAFFLKTHDRRGTRAAGPSSHPI